MATPSELKAESQSNSAIEIDGDSDTLLGLLDQSTSVNPPMIRDWAMANAILELGARYQFEYLPRVVSQNLELCVQRSGPNVFAFASQHDFESLARSAIAGSDYSGWYGMAIKGLVDSDVKGASLNYVLALVRAMRSSEIDSSGRVDWQSAARDFRIIR